MALLTLLVLLSAGLVRVMERDTMVLQDWSEALEEDSVRTATSARRESDPLASESEGVPPQEAPPPSLLPEATGKPPGVPRERGSAPATDPDEVLELLLDSLPPDLYGEVLSSARAGQPWLDDPLVLPAEDGTPDPSQSIDTK